MTYVKTDGDESNEAVGEDCLLDSERKENVSKSIKDVLRVDTYMLPAKIAYFFAIGQNGAFKPYTIPFLVGMGLNQAEAGFIAGVRLVGMMVGGPFWGLITDHRRNHQCILILLGFMSIVLVGGQPLLSVLIGNPQKNICPYVANTTTNVTSAGAPSHKINYKTNMFLIMLFVNIAGSFFEGCIPTFIDTGTIQRINSSPVAKNYGWNRVFGATGFALSSLLAGVAVGAFPTTKVNCYSGAFIVFLANAIGILIAAQFIFPRANNTELKNPGREVSIKKKLFNTLAKFETLLFFCTVFFMGIFQGTYIGFTTLFLKDLNAPTIIGGLTLSIGALAVALCLMLASRLVVVFGGPWNTFSICCISYAMRYLIFANIGNPWLSVPINLLQGFGQGIFLATTVLYVKSISSPEIYTTMYAIMNGVYNGAGYITANILGGQIFSRYGGRVLFTGCGVLAAVWTVVLICFLCYTKCCRRDRQEQNKRRAEKPAKIKDIEMNLTAESKNCIDPQRPLIDDRGQMPKT